MVVYSHKVPARKEILAGEHTTRPSHFSSGKNADGRGFRTNETRGIFFKFREVTAGKEKVTNQSPTLLIRVVVKVR